MKEHNLLYLLARINPERIRFIDDKHEKCVVNLYYEQTSLKLAWFGAVIKSSYFGSP